MVHYQEYADGWKRVDRKFEGKRPNGEWDVAGGGRKRAINAEVTSFFITEFGDEWRAKDLFFELKEIGEIDEVVIPPERNRRGKRYRFACFFNVVDEKLMAIKLDSIVLEGRKLFANLPRFQRVDKNGSKDIIYRVNRRTMNKGAEGDGV